MYKTIQLLHYFNLKLIKHFLLKKKLFRYLDLIEEQY